MPTIPKKPAPLSVPRQDLTQGLDKLKDAIGEATRADGKVDIEAVEKKLAGDAVALEALDAIKGEDSFSRTETRSVSVGCGGGREDREFQVEPKTLEGHEVQSVLGALISARTKVEAKDANADGKIDGDEAKVSAGDDLAGNIADATLEPAQRAFNKELRAWSEAINRVRRNVESRVSSDESCVSMAKHHASSDVGAEALTWAYRTLFVAGQSSRWDMEDALKDAETGFLRFMPFFDATGPGHLSDREIRKHLGTNDLAAYAKDAQAALEDKLGGAFEATYLKGTDLEGVDQTNDPDVQRHVGAGC